MSSSFFNPKVIEYLPLLLSGLVNTVILTLGSMGLGLLVGALLAFAEVYGPKPISVIASSIEQVLRGIPLIVILFIIFFGLPELGITLPPVPSAILGIGLISGSYQSQIIRSAIEGIGMKQWEAALSIGMTRFQAFTNIILPQAVRIMLPGWVNEFTIVLKDTSIAYAIGVTELFTQAIHIAQATSDYLSVLLIIALIYLAITSLVSTAFNYLYERRLRIPGLGGVSG